MPSPITEEQREKLVKLGARVQAIRLDKGLSLEKVAQAIGKDRQSIHRLEKGLINPSYIYLLELCKGLDIDMTDLIQDAS